MIVLVAGVAEMVVVAHAHDVAGMRSINVKQQNRPGSGQLPLRMLLRTHVQVMPLDIDAVQQVQPSGIYSPVLLMWLAVSVHSIEAPGGKHERAV